ncbi:hypothetical protein SS50377_22473 [Spironucleus salmonicida]|uniref:Uncharacterized protein n=1 Tax=Spironucleus salmonicida TaxID=348837 RepID=V6LEB4_9EUKA|nr:hypothetical protein SS50377_22473 [Spironucleus salmonicida]|eukprot:EST42036.1 Hypothetical protein SS50377_18343 [Spironucleus salmonicida]
MTNSLANVIDLADQQDMKQYRFQHTSLEQPIVTERLEAVQPSLVSISMRNDSSQESRQEISYSHQTISQKDKDGQSFTPKRVKIIIDETPKTVNTHTLSFVGFLILSILIYVLFKVKSK